MAMPRSPIRAQRTPQTEEAHIAPEAEATTISAVVPQYLPPFNKENPKFWFLQVEAALRTSKINSDSSRFNYIILPSARLALTREYRRSTSCFEQIRDAQK
ncbi:hypothetical protein K0M31_001700 [Melipona bicolor]|uniref:DUF7041 domain-containing protein n=1 Tax=Melipona bicolor TaxID=60889 RepID=A0AA40GG21_9HYME|nr:hypothetical protein K0M31_001700 [Melipona bicolor]